MILGIFSVGSVFFIGFVAGLVSVFIPRMMLLLSVDSEIAPERYVSVFNADFVWLGVLFAVAIGIICAILEFGGPQEPRAIFMTALGIPALLSGVLNTTSTANKLQQAEQEKVAVLRAVGEQAGIPHERVRDFEPITTAPGQSRSSGDHRLSFVTPAYAESQLPAAVQQRGFDPGIQIQRPRYVLMLKRVGSQEEALRVAQDLQKDVPTAQAVRTDDGYIVVDSTNARSESTALLDAIQLKKRNLTPSLLQVPR